MASMGGTLPLLWFRHQTGLVIAPAVFRTASYSGVWI